GHPHADRRDLRRARPRAAGGDHLSSTEAADPDREPVRRDAEGSECRPRPGRRGRAVSAVRPFGFRGAEAPPPEASLLVEEVMTPNPEALTAGHRIAYAVHCMSVAGFRTVPLVDTDRRPLGIVTVSDVIRWLAQLFPEAILNLPPSETLKRPHEMDAG